MESWVIKTSTHIVIFLEKFFVMVYLNTSDISEVALVWVETLGKLPKVS